MEGPVACSAAATGGSKRRQSARRPRWGRAEVTLLERDVGVVFPRVSGFSEKLHLVNGDTRQRDLRPRHPNRHMVCVQLFAFTLEGPSRPDARSALLYARTYVGRSRRGRTSVGVGGPGNTILILILILSPILIPTHTAHGSRSRSGVPRPGFGVTLKQRLLLNQTKLGVHWVYIG